MAVKEIIHLVKPRKMKDLYVAIVEFLVISRESVTNWLDIPPGHRFTKEKSLVANAVGQVSQGSSSEVINSFLNLTITLNNCQQILAMLAPQL